MYWDVETHGSLQHWVGAVPKPSLCQGRASGFDMTWSGLVGRAPRNGSEASLRVPHGDF